MNHVLQRQRTFLKNLLPRNGERHRCNCKRRFPASAPPRPSPARATVCVRQEISGNGRPQQRQDGRRRWAPDPDGRHAPTRRRPSGSVLPARDLPHRIQRWKWTLGCATTEGGPVLAPIDRWRSAPPGGRLGHPGPPATGELPRRPGARPGKLPK